MLTIYSQMDTIDAANSKRILNANSSKKSHLGGVDQNKTESRNSQLNHAMKGMFEVK